MANQIEQITLLSLASLGLVALLNNNLLNNYSRQDSKKYPVSEVNYDNIYATVKEGNESISLINYSLKSKAPYYYD